MSKFKLAFGIHNHQPVGNFAAVFEDAHQKAYLPFLNLLSEHPEVRMSLHQSGILWNWQKSSNPDYFEIVSKMVDSGQLELMTGGFYEPILCSIPERDAKGQIALLNRFLTDNFHVHTDGLWLTERIWEPHLPKLLVQAGVRYLPVDDTHFIYAGFELSQLTGPFVTESEGYALRLLPIQKRLRYLIPFGEIEDIIAELKKQAEQNPGGMAVYADDGEKFGVWPGTHKHCYEEGWLARFFEALENESDWLEVIPLREAAMAEPVGRAYLPTASYEEMLHWSLPPSAFLEYENFTDWLKGCGKADRYGRFVRGGHWRGFLAKYEESNLMHKKMQRISDLLSDIEQAGKIDPSDLQPIRERLYAAQCNCTYWHGVFGGLYLPHLRQAVYKHMVKAAYELRQLAGTTGVTFEETDYDLDGYTEILVESDELGAVIHPSCGGRLTELCLSRHGFNITDTLSRRREGYHLKLDQAISPDKSDGQTSIHDQVLAKEEGLKDLLVEDWYLKRCFVDHFLSGEVNLEKFQSNRFGEEGDFVLEPYQHKIETDAHTVTLSRNGFVRRPDGEMPVTVSKCFRFDADADWFDVQYVLTSTAPGGVDVDFAVENNFNFQAGHAIDRYVLVDGRRPEDPYLDSTGTHLQGQTIGLVDKYRSLAVAVASNRPAEIWHLPILTVSLSEGGFEKGYQGTTLVFRYRLHLTAKPTTISFRVHAGQMKSVLSKAFAAVELPG
ncbi:MAG: DUF1926 domain-containing protein [candidate division Zixibacteria bacterium]|nr:DUF1926 domain-containing protein [candidate division Zixibacteria bacterium]